jgi:Xaa-Pro aminopeptidase
MIRRLTSEKLTQAAELVAASDVDVWMTFVRETGACADPVLSLLIEGGLVWQSALMVDRSGRKTAIVGNYDAEALRSSGDWDEVIPYLQGIREPLLQVLDRIVPETTRAPRIAVNWSLDDPNADGLTHGMALLLERILEGSRFERSLVSAEGIVRALRGRKSPMEIERIREAVRITEQILSLVPGIARIGRSEREVFDEIQGIVEQRGLGFSWDRHGDPIVNSGPDSMIGHGLPSDAIVIAPGHLFHIDFGILHEGYASDLQRTWWVAEPGTRTPPDDVARAFRAVHGAISAGAAALRPGVEGWLVDQAARSWITGEGYPEYQHGLGHQVGRMAHDGGALLGPRWERYGACPTMPIEAGQVFTLELGVEVPGRGYLGLEEMVVVTPTGCAWLSSRQDEIRILG